MQQQKELTQCINCEKDFGLSDAGNFEKFCSAECEEEHKQTWAELKKEELEHEVLMERLNDQEDIEDLE